MMHKMQRRDAPEDDEDLGLLDEEVNRRRHGKGIRPRLIAIVSCVVLALGLVVLVWSIASSETIKQAVAAKIEEGVQAVIQFGRVKVEKSPSDTRKYVSLTLPNGLDVLIVSDPDTDKSAAALSVNVGHFSDPAELPGLAHFCEHMLFMGSEKYPQENAYNEFLAQNGGGSNAYTASEQTNYFFDVVPSAFPEALDIFAQFFIAPLFSPSSVDREVNAVDSEHSKNKQSDAWRVNMLKRSLSDVDHPLHKFGTGNKDTLMLSPQKKGIVTRDALLEFYHQHYSATRMHLVVYAKENTGQITEMVESSFGSVPSWTSNATKISDKPYTRLEMPMYVKYVPVRDLRTLTLMFPLQWSPSSDFLSKPADYISHIIGHEAPGSAAAYLKERGLIDALYAGLGEEASSFSVFEITVELTEEGLHRTDDVIEALFAYISVIRKDGALEWLWKESKDLARMRFEFQERGDPINYVSSLASNLIDYPSQFAVSGAYTYKKFDADKIVSLLDSLTLNNLIVMIGSQSFDSDRLIEESVYGTRHSLAPLPDTLKRKLAEPLPPPELHLVNPNVFIPSNFTLLWGNGMPFTEDKAIPTQIVREDGVQMWLLTDPVFARPKAYVEFEVSVQRPGQKSAYDSVCGTLFEMLIADELEAITYDAKVAGVSFDIRATYAGLAVSFGGYNDKLATLVKTVVDAIRMFKVKSGRFFLKKDEFHRALRNNKMGNPYFTALRGTDETLTRNVWTIDDMLEALESAKPSDVEQWVRSLQSPTKPCGLVGLAHGNIDENWAMNALNAMRDNLKCGGPDVNQLPQRFTADIREKGGLFRAVAHPNPHDENSALELVYQVGEHGQVTRESLALDASMLMVGAMIKEPCFDTLRTQQQLGYIVACRLKTSPGVQFISVVIQSAAVGPMDLDVRARAFVDEFKANISSTPQSKFENHRQSLLDELNEKPKSLGQLSSRVWHEIRTGRNMFDRSVALADSVKKLSSDQVTAKAHEVLDLKRTLAMWVFAGNEGTPKDTSLYLIPAQGREEIKAPREWQKAHVMEYFSPQPFNFIAPDGRNGQSVGQDDMDQHDVQVSSEGRHTELRGV